MHGAGYPPALATGGGKEGEGKTKKEKRKTEEGGGDDGMSVNS